MLFFVVCDHEGQKLAYVYFEDEPGWRSAAKLLTRGEQGPDHVAVQMIGRCCVATAKFSAPEPGFTTTSDRSGGRRAVPR